MLFSCEICSKLIETSPSKNRRFCSQKCTNKWKKEAYKKQRVEYIIVECGCCGKELERQPSKVNKRNYCNKSCRGKHIWEMESLSQKMVYKPCHGMIGNKKMWFRSKWELVFVQDFLEASGLVWDYEPKSFQLLDGSKYTPDFYIQDDDVYVEIKGYDKSDSTKRFFKFTEEYPEVNIIFANKYILTDFYKLNLDNKYLNSLCVVEGQGS